MKDFFKYVFATVVGIVISTVVLVVLFFVILVGAISSFSTDKKVSILANSVLYLDLDLPITERTPENSLSGLPIFGSGEGTALGFNDLIKALNAAKTDDKIKCIYINVSAPNAGTVSYTHLDVYKRQCYITWGVGRSVGCGVFRRAG